MKIIVSRSGGFAGLTHTWTVDVDEQPDRDTWVAMVSELPWRARPRPRPEPDRFVYVIRWSRHRITLPERRLEGPWRELVDRVRAASAD